MSQTEPREYGTQMKLRNSLTEVDPIPALGDNTHRAILHPVILKNLPERRTVSDDIGRLYTAVQEKFIESLKNHNSVMYLGLDAWQSPNGFDILGTVIYRLVEEDTGGFHLEAMPLDFVKLNKSHTGVYLAQTVQLIVEKFGVKEKICGIVTDNASNNQTMIDTLKSYKWPRFKGQVHWIQCFAHILNLIAQVILRPFGSHQKNRASSLLNQDQDSDEEEEDGESVEDPGLLKVIQEMRNILIPKLLGENVASGLIGEDEIELEEGDLNDMSNEGEDD
ncbi:hypothetical protein PTTG_28611 [Puccinia triticina 1-1 BBBD Race 1]|uniref:DUF659 domain-containing protein n=1 Tax=Puccinia triticina (isolate 1-1 / race 1 (BBBD)) TaxID=630390 RepID=A0A180GBG8_PUCT1|nr:hypothetical protein PTTG_28611 [Puccinia triticina 1-1 BBBD Race 1]